MTPEEWHDLDAVALAEIVRSGEVGPRELVELAIERIETENPAINAVVTTCYSEALAELEARQGRPRFLGVPYLAKDLYAPVRGLRLTNGGRLFGDFVPDFDSTFMARMRAAGFAILGRTNAPEMGLNVTTEPLLHGPTRNPWNLDRIVGGSSGGAAAAVASGMVPVAHATDSAGSIRVPAACTGLVGLKPTRGLNPYGPHRGDAAHGISHENQVTKSVRDMAALLDVTAGPDTGAPYFSPPQEGGFEAALARPLRRLRIGVWDRTFADADVDRECAEAARCTGALLEELGHSVETARPPFDVTLMVDSLMGVLIGSLPTLIGPWELQRGQPAGEGDLEPATLALVERGRAMELTAYLGHLGAMQREVRRMAEFFETCDVLVTPMLAAPPLPLGSLPTDDGDAYAFLDRLFSFSPFAAPFNASGQPAISLPLHWSSDGLPVGVQLAGRYGEDALLLRLAAELEEARPWRGRRPGQPH